MTRYQQVQAILENAVKGESIGAHRNFWRTLTRDQFVAHRVYGRPLVALGNGAASNLVKALRGQDPFDGAPMPRMPDGYDPVPEAEIAIIERWIDDGAPDTVIPG